MWPATNAGDPTPEGCPDLPEALDALGWPGRPSDPDVYGLDVLHCDRGTAEAYDVVTWQEPDDAVGLTPYEYSGEMWVDSLMFGDEPSLDCDSLTPYEDLE